MFTEVLTWIDKYIFKTAHPDIQEKWVKNLSKGELTQPEKDVLANVTEFCRSSRTDTGCKSHQSNRVSHQTQ